MYLKEIAALLANRKSLALVRFFLIITIVTTFSAASTRTLVLGFLLACFISFGVVLAFEYLYNHVDRKLGIVELVSLPGSTGSCPD